jgi:hypothetical protein
LQASIVRLANLRALSIMLRSDSQSELEDGMRARVGARIKFHEPTGAHKPENTEGRLAGGVDTTGTAIVLISGNAPNPNRPAGDRVGRDLTPTRDKSDVNTRHSVPWQPLGSFLSS